MLLTLDKQKVDDFVAAFADYRLFIPRQTTHTTCFSLRGEEAFNWPPLANTALPPKIILLLQAETLMRFNRHRREISIPRASDDRILLLGVRPCDARAIAVLDAHFYDQQADGYYRQRRERTTIVGVACHAPRANCFCTSTGGGPADTTGMDILITDLGDSLLLRPVTTKGDEICRRTARIGARAQQAEIDREQRLHAQAREKVGRELDLDGLAANLPAMWDHPLWQHLAEPCLECGICTYLCPTCYCFDMQDEILGAEGRRCRVWDSCMFKEFTLHASGHNPRPTRRERLRNRVNHKFYYHPQRFGAYACVGCGRCIDNCPVNIDMLDILGRLKEACHSDAGKQPL